MTDPAAARSRPAQLEEIQEDTNVSRVEPFRPCVASTGSTAEPPTGAVTAAERIQKFNERFPLSAQQAWTYDNPYTNDYALLRDLIAERAALAAARLALQQKNEQLKNERRNLRAEVQQKLEWYAVEQDRANRAEAERDEATLAIHHAASEALESTKRADAAEAAGTQLRQELEALVGIWQAAAKNWRKGQMTREKRGDEILAACARDLADRLALAREETVIAKPLTLVEMLRLRANEIEQAKTLGGPSLIMLLRDAAQALVAAREDK